MNVIAFLSHVEAFETTGPPERACSLGNQMVKNAGSQQKDRTAWRTQLYAMPLIREERVS